MTVSKCSNDGVCLALLTCAFSNGIMLNSVVGIADQSNFSVETTTETSRCEANMRVWCHLMSSLEEEDIYNGQEPHVSLSGAAPEDSCLVFPCISQVMVWLEQQRLAAQASFPPCHIQVRMPILSEAEYRTKTENRDRTVIFCYIHIEPKYLLPSWN